MYECANKKNLRKKIACGKRGSLLVSILVITALFVTLGMLALQFIINQNAASNFRVDRERALEIAEAGAEYYRWHLAHVPEDYQDGTGGPGPYVHQYRDANNNIIGAFSLEITPPSSGSTVVTIKSTGQLTDKLNSARSVTIKQGIPSFTKYAVVANADMRFGVGTEVFGPIHSNGGIRFDGVAHNLITSLQYSYDDPDHTGNNEFGVHTHVNAPPATGVDNNFRPLEAPTVAPPPYQTPPNRSDVFMVGRQFPVPQVDFNSITSDLNTLKTKAEANGIHLLASGGQGYHITFRIDGKVDMRIVNTQLRCQYNSGTQWRDYGYCSNNFNRICTQTSNCNYCSLDGSRSCTTNFNCSSVGAGTCITSGFSCLQSSHSIGSRAADQSNFTYKSASSIGYSMPANGLIFIEDDVWVDGVVPNNTRVTLVAAKEPLASGTANIFFSKDLTYAHYCDNASQNACSQDSECSGGADCVDNSDNTAAVGLITQNNILVGYFSEDDLRVDAALIAQNGRVGRPYYGASFTASTTNSNFQLYPTAGSLNPDGGTTCQQYRKRTSIITYGSLATNQRYGFSWTGYNLFNCGTFWNNSGYCNRTLNFDSNLTYAPPPDFPTTGEYETLSWEEN